MKFIPGAFMSLILMFLSIILLGQEEEWSLAKDKNGIKVYTRMEEGSDFKEYRGECLVKVDFKKIKAILLDLEDYPSWVNDCDEVTIIKEEPGLIIYHVIYAVPWPFMDRDVVSRMNIYMTADTLELSEREAPGVLEEYDEYVRMPENYTRTRIVRLNETEVYYTTEGYFNPGGSLPKWLVNSFISDGPYKAMSSLKKLVGDE